MTNGRLGATEERHLRTIFELGAVSLLNDGQLLERFGSDDRPGSELAFAALVERHGPMVFRVCRGALGDRHSAEDAFQATFLILARKARALWVRESVAPWLHTVASRVSASCRASETRRRKHERLASRPESFHPRESDDLSRIIHEEIDRLPEPYRAAVVLCHLEDLTQHEAANRLGWPVGTLQSRLDRGRRRLRDRLGRRGLAPSSLKTLPYVTIPVGLLASTTRAATLLSSGRPIAGMIGPSVFAIINQVSTKGILMAKWKIGAATLMVTATLITSAMGLGQGKGTGDQPSTPTRADQPPLAQAAIPRIISEPNHEPAPFDEDGKPVARAVGPIVKPNPIPPAVVPIVKADPIPPVANRPNFPVLLGFHSFSNIPSRQLRSGFEELVRAGYPVKLVDVDVAKDVVARYKVDAVPTLILVDGSGVEMSRHPGSLPTIEMANFYNQQRAKVVNRPKLKTGIQFAPPELSESVVRVFTNVNREEPEGDVGFGTIIRSDETEALILSCAHIFRDKGELNSQSGKDFVVNKPVVDVQVPRPNGKVWINLAAQVVAHDLDNDLVLLRVLPGQKLRARQVAPRDWKPGPKYHVVSMGMTQAVARDEKDVSFFDEGVNLIDTAYEVASVAGRPRLPLIHSDGRYLNAMAGCGLLDDKDALLGVFLFGRDSDHSSFYAGPEAIHKLVDRSLKPGAPAETPPAVPEDREPQPGPKKQVEAEPRKDDGPRTQPLDTVVKVSVASRLGKTSLEERHGLGTVIGSHDGESLILTSVRPFLQSPNSNAIPTMVDVTVHVILSVERLGPGVMEEVPAELVAHDLVNSLALLRVRPGRKLPTARVVPASWKLKGGMRMISTGHNDEGLRTCWETTLLNPAFVMGSRNDTALLPYLQCSMKPQPSQTGGGLFNDQDEMVGVFQFGLEHDMTGLYAGPEAIRKFLERSNLASTIDAQIEGPNVPGSSPALTVPVPTDPPNAEPVLNIMPLPRPWETVVRVKVHYSDKEWGFGSGVVIKSTPDESIILAAAHNFRFKNETTSISEHFRFPIMVDLFDGTLTGSHRSMVQARQRDVPAQGINFDLNNDLVLLRIRPGQQIPASPVVPASWKPEPGMTMVSLGCSHGNDATAWSTRILESRVALKKFNSGLESTMIKCANQPKEGRSGGGLYTIDGYLAGICCFADPNEKVGLYARPEAIRKFLADNSLSSVYPAEGKPAVQPVVVEEDGLLLPPAVSPLLVPQPDPVATPGRAGSARLELPPRMGVPDASEPPTSRPVSEQERRLIEVERKLDLILESLKKPSTPPR